MFPIVLVHGIARFDILLEIQRQKLSLPEDPLSDEFQYFRGIKTHLESHGFAPVYSPNLDFAGSVSLRAEQLGIAVNELLSETGAGRAHIIAHSMGGLDARRMIVEHKMAEKVVSLTTIGTPHQGTVLADHVINRGGRLWLEVLEKAVKLDLSGLRDLTTFACRQFNRLAEDEEAKNNVVYQTYASSEDFDRMFLPLAASWAFIRNREGRNDGLVPFYSQQWRKELTASDGTRKIVAQKEFPVPADHLNQIGWWDLEEAVNPLFGGSWTEQKKKYEEKIKSIYLEIVRDLQNIPMN
jgi:triacylglycerol lipase